MLLSCENLNKNNHSVAKYDIAYSSKTKIPETLKLTRCLYFGDVGENTDLKLEFMEAFKERTDIKLEITYPPRNNYMEKVNLMISSGEVEGLVNFFSPFDMLQAIDNDVIEPLSDYLEGNENWELMPDDYKKMYTINDEVYGVAAGYEGTYFSRSFREDWLDNLGLEAPENLDELFEVARAFTEDDPDGNGKDDTVGLTSSWFWNLQDIFQAFDCSLDNTGESPINWDPVSGKWQDSMLKPEMKDALIYLKELYNKGYLDKDIFTNTGANMREKLWSGEAGSSFYWVMHGYKDASLEMKNNLPEARWTEIPALKGKRTDNLNRYNMGGLLYVMVKDTEEPVETINTFVDLLSNKESYFMLNFGIEDRTFRIEDNKLFILENPEIGSPYALPGLTNEMPNFNRFNYPVLYEATKEEEETALMLFEIEKKMTQRAMDENLFFMNTEPKYNSPISKDYFKNSNEYRKIFEDEMASAILGEKSVEQALFDYRVRMRKMGADNTLKEANEFIGKESLQKY